MSGGDCQAKMKIGVKRLLTLPSRQQTSGCHLRHIQLTCTFLSLPSHLPYFGISLHSLRVEIVVHSLPLYTKFCDRDTSKFAIVQTQTISQISTRYRTPARLRNYLRPTKLYLRTLHSYLPCWTVISLRTTRPVDALATWFGPDNQDGKFKHLQC